MAIPAGHQWVHVTMRRRLVEALDRARGGASRENYLARLVETDVLARQAVAAQQVPAAPTSTEPPSSSERARLCGAAAVTAESK